MVRLLHDGRGIAGDSRVLDVSSGGFALVAPAPLRCGENVSFRLRLSEGVSIEGSARVCWLEENPRAGGFLHGAEFVRLPFLQRQRLGTFLDPGRLKIGSFFDAGLVLAVALVALLALRDYFVQHPWTDDASWIVAPSFFIVGLLGWTLASRLRSHL